jgi:phosphoserine phosphatase
MKIKNKIGLLAGILVAGLFISCNRPNPSEEPAANPTAVETDALASWNDGKVKDAIIDFVERVTKEGSPDYITPADRIATFDNDGTLWAEQPVIQGMFAFMRVKKMAEKDPSLKNKQPFKAVIEGDQQYLHSMDVKQLVGLVIATHTGMTEEEFEEEAQQFFDVAKHPKLGVPISQLVYKPQTELLQYLRDNEFKTFICSGGTVEFMRAVSEEYYGIPDEQVIGTRFKYSFDESSNSIKREGELNSYDDKKEKPVNIQYHIGKRPVFACGNERSGGDIYMLRFSQGSKYPSFQLLVNHDDEQREFLYQEKDSISLKWAKQYNWNVVSIKNDWKEVFVK